MTVSLKSLGIDRLNVDERRTLVEEIWASICADAKAFPLTNEQRAELDRRAADDDAFPDDVMPWDEIKAAARLRGQRYRVRQRAMAQWNYREAALPSIAGLGRCKDSSPDGCW